MVKLQIYKLLFFPLWDLNLGLKIILLSVLTPTPFLLLHFKDTKFRIGFISSIVEKSGKKVTYGLGHEDMIKLKKKNNTYVSEKMNK